MTSSSHDPAAGPPPPVAARPRLTEFTDRLEFALDPFQLSACSALEDGHGVLVCAPTGAGKTIVGEFAVHLALAAGSKCFYTTPIKALSNQKYADLVAVHGHDAVGLLTGDSSINPHAPVVVMTTEVVRNMIYANSPALHGLSHVVMDEVHFLADRFRGAVWEEVILHLDPSVKVVSLSATVSNAEEFGDWIKTVRGDTTVVVDEHRPVPLWQHMMVGNRILDLFDRRTRGGKPEVNPELTRYIKQREMVDDHDRVHGRGPRSGRGRGGRGPGIRAGAVVSRPDLIARLDREGLLPAITFVFSRAGCDAALDQCLRSGLTLLGPDEAGEVDAVVAKHVGELSDADREVLRVDRWASALARGFAAHHAGMLPAFRHAVEELFVRGLVRAVFATETLALGINMPARSVVLERLVKFNGEAHVDLTPGEFTQLTGRAGRRGIDVEGHAVVVWSPELDPARVAGLAGARTFPLRSSFAPEYNMAINLIDRLGLDGAKNLLERSFAQFQADRSVVGQHRKIDATRSTLRTVDAELTGRASSLGIDAGTLDPGDDDDHSGFFGYMRLRQSIRARERDLKFRTRLDRQDAVVDDLFGLKRGHVIALRGGRHRGLAVVVEQASDRRDPRPLVLCEDAWCGRVGARDFVNPPEVLGDMRLPKQVDRRTGRGRRDLASSLRNTGIEMPRGRPAKRAPAADDSRLTDLRARLRAHPAHEIAGSDELFRLAERRARVQREVDGLVDAVRTRTSTLSVTFDRVVSVLEHLGYLVRDDDSMVVTPSGAALARVYSESDLLICECLRGGIWDRLTAPQLAAVVSSVVYESRRDAYAGADLVTGEGAVRDALTATHRAWRALSVVEERHHVAVTREPDAGFALAMHLWASGRPLAEVLAVAGDRGRPLPAGDFVRWSRQVIDLLEQIRMAASDTPVAATARSAARAVTRGVVAVEVG